MKSKNLIVGLTCILGLASHAIANEVDKLNGALISIEADAIYFALNVDEQPLRSPRTQLKYQKSVGGLTCIKLNDTRSGDKFSCSVSESQVDAAAIYAALDVEEKPLPAIRTKLKNKKSVGKLSCIKINDFRTGDSFGCSISL